MFETTIAGSLPKPSWLAEPHKLWRRYLIGNPRFLARIVRHYYLRMPL